MNMTEQNKQQEFENKLNDLLTKVRRQGMAIGQITAFGAILGMIEARKESKIPPSKFLSDLKLSLEARTKNISEALDKLKDNNNDINNDKKESNISDTQSGDN